MKIPTQISILSALCARFLPLLTPLQAAVIAFVGHQVDIRTAPCAPGIGNS